jgi:iron complex outermembrane recepter protein
MHLAHRAAASIAALITFAAGTLAAQQTGTIRGTITNSAAHTPISGARAAISTPERVAITDARGTYVLRDVPAGTYRVFTSAIGMKPSAASATVSPNGTTTYDVALQEGSLLLSSVVVSATRAPLLASEATATVNVLTPEQVRQSPAREAQDLLREIPAVELPRTSSLVGGTAQIVSIRGVDEGRTGVMLDGIPINDAWGEWIDWGRVPKAMLDHVEVVEGGQSNLYGSGAMGGLISFFSRPLAPGAMELQVDGGNRDARHAYVAGGVPLANALSLDINGDYQEKGGYRLIAPVGSTVCTSTPCTLGGGPVDVTSNVTQRNSYARLNYAPNASWSAFLTGHLFGDSRGLGTPLTFDNRNQSDASFGFNHDALLGGSVAVRGWDSRMVEGQRSSAIRSAILRNAEDSSLTAQIPSHDWGGSVQWSRTNAWHLESFSLGADLRHYQGDFNEVDFSTSGCPTSPACGSLTQRVSSGGNQTLSGAFVSATATPLSRLRVDMSGRVDQWNNNDGHALTTSASGSQNPTTYANKTAGAFSPRVGAMYQLHSSFSVRGAFYKSFRAPNLAELYRKQVSSTSITVPNPQLDAETAVGREAGFDWQPLDWFQAKGTYYVAEYNNFNSPVTLTANKPADCGTVPTCRQRLAINKSRSQGGELYTAIRPVHSLFLSAAVNYDDDRQQSGLPATTTDNNKPHINRVPSPKQTLRGTWSSPALGDWTVMWRHEGPTTSLQGFSLAPFSVIDADVQRELRPNLRGFISVENLGNTLYQVNVAGTGAATNPFIYSVGLPRTVRIGVDASKF